MKSVWVFCFCLSWLCMAEGFGQERDSKRLHIGDTMPPLLFRMLNDRDSVLSLKNIQNKLVILSFWTPSCSFSASQLPVLDSLQNEFPHDLRIVPVGFDGREEGLTKRYLAGMKGTREGTRMPVALQTLGDTSLYHLLPFMGLPQNVWLDSHGVILAITDHFALTKENIAAEIRGQHLPLEIKNYDFGFDANRPLLLNGNGGADSDFSYRSLITPYKPSILLSGIQERTPSCTRIAEGNMTPVALLQIAIAGCDSTGELPDYDPMNKRLRNLVSGNDLFDTAYFDLPQREYAKAEALRKRQAFCYELILPPSFSFRDAYRKMLADLCDYFGVTAKVEKQPVASLVIVKKGKIKQENERGEEEIHVSAGGLSFSFAHCTTKRIADVLNNVLELPVVADATGIKGKVSLSLRLTSLHDKDGLQKGLEACHLRLKERLAQTNLFVIRNK